MAKRSKRSRRKRIATLEVEGRIYTLTVNGKARVFKSVADGFEVVKRTVLPVMTTVYRKFDNNKHNDKHPIRMKQDFRGLGFDVPTGETKVRKQVFRYTNTQFYNLLESLGIN